MRNLFLCVALGIVACDGEDVLTQVPQDETSSGEQVAVEMPDGEIIHATMVRTLDELAGSEYPDGYCEANFWVVQCGDSIAMVAHGIGCLKTLEILFNDEAEEVCDE